ncbi:MAG TPA: PspC domain-containing protein [Chloroflexota bacterium]|nr:PspC domain-containing protein [Chloroflexota bacterium]
MYEDSTARPLLRSITDRRLGGVAGGLAHYFHLDPTLVRTLWVLAVPFSGGLALLAYFALWLALPEGDAGWAEPVYGARHMSGAKALGVVLVVLGSLMVLGHLAPFVFHAGHILFPLILVGLGIALLVRHERHAY